MTTDPNGPAWDLSAPLLRIPDVTPAVTRIVEDLVDFDRVRDIMLLGRKAPALILRDPAVVAVYTGILAEAAPLWVRLQNALGEEFANACVILLHRKKKPSFELVAAPAMLLDPWGDGQCER